MSETPPITGATAEAMGEFGQFAKVATTRISLFTVPPGVPYQTPEGLRAEDEPTRLAFDVQGGVYPIRESVFEASYVPVDAWSIKRLAARPSRAAEPGLRATGKCGCNCICHGDEGPDWPGPCAACCEPGMNCDCGRALASRAAEPLDAERLADVLRYSPIHWEVIRADGAYVMTRMFGNADQAAAFIAAEYLLAAPHEAVPEREAAVSAPDGRPGGWDYPGHFDPMTGKDRDR